MTREERRAQWQERIESFRSSGQSVAAWCREHDLKEHRLRYWLRRFPPTPGATEEASTQWLPVAVREDAPAEGGLVIRAGRLILEVSPECDRGLLADVLDVVMARC